MAEGVAACRIASFCYVSRAGPDQTGQVGGTPCCREAAGYVLGDGSGFEGTWGQQVAEDARTTLALDKAWSGHRGAGLAACRREAGGHDECVGCALRLEPGLNSGLKGSEPQARQVAGARQRKLLLLQQQQQQQQQGDA